MKKPSKEKIEAVRNIVDPKITLRHSEIRCLFGEFKDKIILLERENDKLRQLIIKIKSK